MPRLLDSVATGESLALDFDHRNRTVCWLDRGKAALNCAPVDRLEDSWQLPQVGQTGRLADCQTGRLADWQTDRLADWQTGRLAEWQSGRLAD